MLDHVHKAVHHIMEVPYLSLRCTGSVTAGPNYDNANGSTVSAKFHNSAPACTVSYFLHALFLLVTGHVECC